jgi:hypothetical protein
MTKTAQAMYAVSLDEAVDLISNAGKQVTIMLRGHIGCGKTSTLLTLQERFPDHKAVLFDGTSKDLGDLWVPVHDKELGCIKMAPAEEFGIHLNMPLILCLDEISKANKSVKNGMMRVMLERNVNGTQLHPDTIIYATGNLGNEGLGDMLEAHQINRMCIIETAKPTTEEWIAWAINNDVDPTIISFVNENPQVLADFRDVGNPEDNQYIYDPRRVEIGAFVSPRSLEKASVFMKMREHYTSNALTAAMIGEVGARAAMDLLAYTKLVDDLPKLEDIKTSPTSAKVPTTASALCMIVYRTLASIEKDWVGAWLTYLKRLPPEAQAMFANGVRSPKYNKQSIIMTHKLFTEWARDNTHMFAADKV